MVASRGWDGIESRGRVSEIWLFQGLCDRRYEAREGRMLISRQTLVESHIRHADGTVKTMAQFRKDLKASDAVVLWNLDGKSWSMKHEAWDMGYGDMGISRRARGRSVRSGRLLVIDKGKDKSGETVRYGIFPSFSSFNCLHYLIRHEIILG